MIDTNYIKVYNLASKIREYSSLEIADYND